MAESSVDYDLAAPRSGCIGFGRAARQKHECEAGCWEIVLVIDPTSIGLLLGDEHTGNVLIPIMSDKHILSRRDVAEDAVMSQNSNDAKSSRRDFG